MKIFPTIKNHYSIKQGVILCGLFIFSLVANAQAYMGHIGVNSQTETICTHYVAPNGDNNNTGSLPSAPWKTIQKAANSTQAGDVVCIRAGSYSEMVNINVSGSATEGSITFQNYPNEQAILDGTNLAVPSGWGAMIHIQNRSYITISGLTVRNYKITQKNHVPIGILIDGSGEHIELTNNTIYGIETNYTGANGGDAHGIAIYGTSASTPLSNIIINNNKLYNLKLGSSEALVINGNVDGFQVKNNVIRDSNNIGIDAIGFEGTSPDPAYDQARNGVISGNTVYNINSYGNPAYGNERSAGCIYVDGGTQITLEQNIVHHCNLGIELASEHAGKSTSYITVRNNFIYGNTQAGISIGGYDSQRGSTEYSTIVNNSLYNNATQGDWGAELYIQYDTRNNTIMNNIIFSGPAKKFIESWSPVMSGNTVDYNLYFSNGGGTNGTWIWKGATHTTFSDYQQFSGNDGNGLAGMNPQFLDADSGNLKILAASPAIDTGSDVNCPAIDLFGTIRPAGEHCDIGAAEYKADANNLFNKLYSQGIEDGWILESIETSNVGGTMNSTASTLNLGDDAANRQYRATLSFDTSPLPDDAMITSVTLKLKYAGKTGTLPFSSHGNLLTDIRRGPFSNNSILQLNDFKAIPSRNSAFFFTNTKLGNWFYQSLNSTNFQYINLNGVTQFRLRFAKDDNNDLGADFLKIYSGNAGVSNRPQLIIEYYVP
ncbi:MAG: DUF5123 domain-containing protein [Chloroflexi bacterium]|nr:DUF5123 domain-containing protein [Chloroflexota bacterium]